MWDLILEIFGFIIGLAYLYYEYKANKLVWLMSIIMPCISMVLYFDRGLYADFSINIYYLIIAVYGYIHWTKGGEHKEAKQLPITHISWTTTLICVAATLDLWVLLWWLLTSFTNSNVPVADGFTTALSIVALWMMARKYSEQWLAWLVVDAVCVGLYIYKGIYFYATLYAIYTVIAYFGYKRWCRDAIKA